MISTVNGYLQRFPALAEYTENWEIQGRMRVQIGLADEPPPPELLSSVLTIVFTPDGKALYLEDENDLGLISRFLVGGRTQGQESLVETIVREVAEETGWIVQPLALIGYRHFEQLDPMIAASDRPYPHFLQPIFASVSSCFVPNAVIAPDELPFSFVERAQIDRLVKPDHRFMITAAYASFDA